jgi:Protein of unknown function (DUF3606)
MISKTVTPDRSKIIEHENHVKYWTRHFGVTKTELARAIERRRGLSKTGGRLPTDGRQGYQPSRQRGVAEVSRGLAKAGRPPGLARKTSLSGDLTHPTELKRIFVTCQSNYNLDPRNRKFKADGDDGPPEARVLVEADIKAFARKSEKIVER